MKLYYIKEEIGKIKEEINEHLIISSRSNGGTTIIIDEIKIAIDYWDPKVDIIFLSHAHFDHIPFEMFHYNKNLNEWLNREKFPIILCSQITKDLIKERMKSENELLDDCHKIGKTTQSGQIFEYDNIKITLINNGHVYGSNSMLIEGSETVLYTSDFITEDRELPNNRGVLKGLKPHECDHLIMECTFGSPIFQFPSFQEQLEFLNTYVEEKINHGISLILFGYAYGKSQLLFNMLKHPSTIFLEKNTSKITEIIKKYGVRFPDWRKFGIREVNAYLKKNECFTFITPLSFIFQKNFQKLQDHNISTGIFSGKTLSASFREKYEVDLYMPLSDHCDCGSLMRFVEQCNPNNVYLETGRIEEFSYLLMKQFPSMNIRALKHSNPYFN
ncbi:MAG: hypothetical protein ACTSRT_17845 [Promethearchaeota archaeon]